MRINGISIQGIFQYKLGLNYEVNDLILFNNTLYIVISDYSSEVSPSESKSCEEYVYHHSIKNFSDLNDKKLISSEAVQFLVNSYIKGLGIGGEVQRLSINTLSDLNGYLDTGVYYIDRSTGDPFSSVILGSNNLLVRIYKSGLHTIQEFIDPNLPAIYYRTFYSDWSPLTVLINSDESTSEALALKLSSISSKYSSIVTKLETLENQSRMTYRECVITPSMSVTVETGNNKLVTVIIQYDYDTDIMTESVVFDTQIPASITLTPNGVKLYHSYSGGTSVIEIQDPSLTNALINRILLSHKY